MPGERNPTDWTTSFKGRTHHPGNLCGQLTRHWPVVVILFVFLLVYVSISFVNHWLLRTYALDLGLYSNAAWKYAHGILPDRSLFMSNNDPLLADHFDLHLILWAPLTYLLGEWTLLVVQVVAVLFGGLGGYRLCLAVSEDRTLATVVMMCGLGFFGVITALAFDFHSNVVAAMALPWYFLALHRGRHAASWGFLLFMLVAKENMGLWLFVVALAAMGVAWIDRRMNRMLIAQAVVALAWSVVVLGWAMPAMTTDFSIGQVSKYAHLGASWDGILRNTLAHPAETLRYFVECPNDPDGSVKAIKIEFYKVLFVSGAWALLLRWPFLLMAIPLLAQKMLSWSMTGLFAHYSIEFAVLLPIAMMDALLLVRSRQWRLALALIGLGAVIGGAIYTLDLPLEHASNKHGDHDRLRFYQGRHYRRALDVRGVYAVLDRIPPEASVSAASCLVPHMVSRRHLSAYPIMHDTKYVVLLKDEVPWPLSPEEFSQAKETYQTSPDWSLAADSAGVLVFRRISPLRRTKD